MSLGGFFGLLLGFALGLLFGARPGPLRANLARDLEPDSERPYFHFALAKALEDAGDFAQAFAHYAKANALVHAKLDRDPEDMARYVVRAEALFTAEFFARRKGAGSPARDPLFIVGLPRSGSTLIEQILASHSAIEGTAELPTIRHLVDELERRERKPYPELLADLPPDRFRGLGEDYIARTRRQRRTANPLFTDKMPANFEHIGLIALILPNAKIIDVRRHPLACCVSNFRQLYVRGNEFSYDLAAAGRHYAHYVELMDHFDRVLPGRILRVGYEDLVADTEQQIRRLLAFCGVAFEPACLEFHKTERMVRTVSSEQVRRPISADAVDHWRNYDPWLEPLKTALGPKRLEP